jgi:HAD superfamily hydrolase (TIGR01450 family)
MLADVRGIAFDLDGTIYLGPNLLPGALQLLEALAAADVPFLFATNNSSKTGEQYVRHLRGLGLRATRAQVVTSNDVASTFLRGAGFSRPYLLATPDVTDEYRDQGFEPTADEPDCLLLTFDTSLSYEKLRRASDLIRHGLPYYATHPDLVCPTPTGPIPDCGAFIALLEAATGVRPTVLGKPERHMVETIAARLDLPTRSIAFVGDRLYTDVRMANDHGMVSVLTLTGETSRADLAASADVPRHVVESLTALAAALPLAAGPSDGVTGRDIRR